MERVKKTALAEHSSALRQHESCRSSLAARPGTSTSIMLVVNLAEQVCLSARCGFKTFVNHLVAS
jgi:hypothetical protein